MGTVGEQLINRIDALERQVQEFVTGRPADLPDRFRSIDERFNDLSQRFDELLNNAARGTGARQFQTSPSFNQKDILPEINLFWVEVKESSKTLVQVTR